MIYSDLSNVNCKKRSAGACSNPKVYRQYTLGDDARSSSHTKNGNSVNDAGARVAKHLKHF